MSLKQSQKLHGRWRILVQIRPVLGDYRIDQSLYLNEFWQIAYKNKEKKSLRNARSWRQMLDLGQLELRIVASG
ncbi:MAG: hypothetical protein HW387_195 [Parachlamydiales bacterium]|nr:hypothetical protein [Parachlamydiales bacterium]